MTHMGDLEVKVTSFEFIFKFKILLEVFIPLYCLNIWIDLFNTWPAV